MKREHVLPIPFGKGEIGISFGKATRNDGKVFPSVGLEMLQKAYPIGKDVKNEKDAVDEDAIKVLLIFEEQESIDLMIKALEDCKTNLRKFMKENAKQRKPKAKVADPNENNEPEDL